MTQTGASRRNVITGLAAAGVAVPVLAACGGDSGGDGDTTGSAETPAESPGQTPGQTASGGATAAAGAIRTADIPVGGGKIFKDDKVVVTQPVAGEFKAFTAVCTHQGCVVANVGDGTINCTCHGSRFSIEDGSVDEGPASKPLSEKSVTVTGDSLTVS